jgi:uncharacterized protein YndB with AHSA1/START domain
MLKIILISLGVIVVAFLVIAAFQPADFRVMRQATVAAPVSRVFEQVNDLHKWNAWSPWVKMDPNMKQTFSGPVAGEGAVQAWEGNSQVGSGKMTITESRPNQFIRFKLEFLKPFAATNTAEFTFEPVGNETIVRWSMEGERNYVCKAMGLLMNMDKMIGGSFEQGLASMKQIVETEPARVTAL